MIPSAFCDQDYAAFQAAQAEAVSATDQYREGQADARTAVEATDRAVRQLKRWLDEPAAHPATDLNHN